MTFALSAVIIWYDVKLCNAYQ